MRLEGIPGSIKDFAGDVSEGIQDIVADVAEFSQNAMESLGEDVVENLRNGDLDGAIDCSDMPAESKETMKAVFKEFVGTQEAKLLLNGIAKVAVGVLGIGTIIKSPASAPIKRGCDAGASIYYGLKDLSLGIQLLSAGKELKHV